MGERRARLKCLSCMDSMPPRHFTGGSGPAYFESVTKPVRHRMAGG